jgi:hypothetical protein
VVECNLSMSRVLSQDGRGTGGCKHRIERGVRVARNALRPGERLQWVATHRTEAKCFLSDAKAVLGGVPSNGGYGGFPPHRTGFWGPVKWW